MPSPSDGSPTLRISARMLVRALLYAGAVALLVLFAPGEEHVFIYQGF